MNDKELDQILRKSLRPEVSEEELEVWDRAPRMESEHTMRRHTIIKSTVAAAACLALVAGIGYGHFSDIGKSPAQQGTHLPQVCAWQRFKKFIARSTGHSPGGLAAMRRSTSRYSPSITVCAWEGVIISSLDTAVFSFHCLPKYPSYK